MREVPDRNKQNCFELYSDTNDVIKACKTDSEGKVVEGNIDCVFPSFEIKILGNQNW